VKVCEMDLLSISIVLPLNQLTPDT